MKMHSHFTEIPLRSFEAMAFEGHLSEVLLALIVDPLEAEDVARSIHEIHDGSIELVSDNGVINAPIRVDDFADLGLKAFESMKITVSQWVMTTDGASDALRVLTVWDRRFGVWCACAVAREALRYVPAGEQRPLRAIEAAEAWVNGNATINTVRDAAAASYVYAAASYVSASRAAADAAAAANAAAAAALRAASRAAYDAASDAYASRAASDAASAYAYANASAAWEANRDAELIRLREVVANACLTFPG